MNENLLLAILLFGPVVAMGAVGFLLASAAGKMWNDFLGALQNHDDWRDET